MKRILIANRGEIALRILRSCREAGVETVAVYSEADRDALYVQLAGQSVCIGPARAAGSYLNQNALLAAALATGCDGIHPGYGFLSENADFADACAKADLTFIGPPGDVIRRAGAKSSARTLMRGAGVPVTPGSDGPVRSEAEALAAAERVGYPVMLKASAGGGGRGIRSCEKPSELKAALACFGDGEMYLEKLVLHPRHIEIQVLADCMGNVVHLGDRDCSLQRRSQKLGEEAPAWGIPPELREKMGEAAVRAAKAVGYENAGTVEFLLDPDGEHFYFMEMNIDRVLERHKLTAEDVYLFVFHQANARIIDLVAKKYRIPPQKYCKNIQQYGNTSAASIPVVLSELEEAGRLSSGSRALLVGFGGGLTWGGTLVEMA